MSLNKHTWEATVNKVVFSGIAKRKTRWKEEVNHVNLYGKCSFVWEVLICSGPQAAALLIPCTSEKFLACSSFGLIYEYQLLSKLES